MNFDISDILQIIEVIIFIYVKESYIWLIKSHFGLEFRSVLHSLLSELLSTRQTIQGSSHKTPVPTVESITSPEHFPFVF